MQIKSNFVYRGKFQSQWDSDIIKNEPMLFNCDMEAAKNMGGPVTRNFLENMPDDYKQSEIVVDSRVHMLMPGWFPCIPGFHHDDVPRSGRDGQPNYINPEYRSMHLLGLVNGDICPTEFAVGDIELDIPETGIIYKQWHPKVVEAIAAGSMQSVSARSGEYLEFDDRTFHQGVRAVANGWRWFIRVSKNTDRTHHCTNELRRQVQVYLEHPMEGW